MLSEFDHHMFSPLCKTQDLARRNVLVRYHPPPNITIIEDSFLFHTNSIRIAAIPAQSPFRSSSWLLLFAIIPQTEWIRCLCGRSPPSVLPSKPITTALFLWIRLLPDPDRHPRNWACSYFLCWFGILMVLFTDKRFISTKSRLTAGLYLVRSSEFAPFCKLSV